MFLAIGCLGKTHLHLLLSKLLKNLSKHSLMQRLIYAKPGSWRAGGMFATPSLKKL